MSKILHLDPKSLFRNQSDF